jgi:hypothetical protein
MSRINPRNVLDLVIEDFIDHTPSAITAYDRELAADITRLLKDCTGAGGYVIDREEILEDADSDEESDGEPEQTSERVTFTLPEADLKKGLEFYRSSTTGTRSLSSMAHNTKIKTQNQLHQMLSYEKRQGPRLSEKHSAINEAVYQQYRLKRSQRVIIHDRDLRRWATREAHSQGLHEFKAGHSWLHHFKVQCCMPREHKNSALTSENTPNCQPQSEPDCNRKAGG